VSYLQRPILTKKAVTSDGTYCLSKVREGNPAGPGVTETICKRPFPTRPKFAEDARAKREV
jgi:hypothetical protein